MVGEKQAIRVPGKVLPGDKWRKRRRFVEDTEATSGRVVVREYELHSDLENYNP